MHDFHACRSQTDLDNAYTNAQRIVDATRNAGITLQITLGAIAAAAGRPTHDGVPCESVPRALGIMDSKTGPPAFGKFVAQMVPWFYERGVRRFSLYNEPNLNFFLCAGQAIAVNTQFMEDQVKCKGGTLAVQAALYYKLYKSGYGAIKGLQQQKKIGTDVQIMFGEISAAHHGIEFMEAVVKSGKVIAHGVNIHPYQFCTHPSTKSKPKKSDPCTRWMPGGMGWLPDWQKSLTSLALSKKLVSPSGKKVPLYLTEFGYLISPKPAIIANENVRAQWLYDALKFAKKNGVRQMLVFGLFGNTRTDVWDSGILKPDGTPLESFNKLRQWARENGYPQSRRR